LKTQHKKGFVPRSLTCLLVLSLGVACALGALWLAGCTTPAQDSSATDNTNSGDSGTAGNSGTDVAPVTPVDVTGTISEINGTELLVDVTESGTDALQGSVRVDTGQIESSIVDGLKVGDTVKLEFSGVIGMSEPPFISATKLEVVK